MEQMGEGGSHFGAKKHFYRCIWHFLSNTSVKVFFCDTGDFRAHIFCPQMTQQLAKKHYDTGLNNCLQMHCHKSIMDTVKIGERLAYAN